MTEWITHLEKLLPGAMGSAGALLWINGTWKRKLGLLVFGVIVANYTGTWVAHETDIPETVAGLMVGLFGMAIVDSLFRAWQDLALSTLLNEFVRARLGLPPKE